MNTQSYPPSIYGILVCGFLFITLNIFIHFAKKWNKMGRTQQKISPKKVNPNLFLFAPKGSNKDLLNVAFIYIINYSIYKTEAPFDFRNNLSLTTEFEAFLKHGHNMALPYKAKSFCVLYCNIFLVRE